MSGPPLLIVGAGGHATVVVDAAQRAGFDVVGLVDDAAAGACETVLGRPVLGPPDAALDGRLDLGGALGFVVAIGDNRVRAEVYGRFESAGFVPTTIVHPGAVVAESARLGTATLVAAGAVVNPLAIIGANVIVNTRASIDHHCEIGDHCHIAPGTTLGGQVTVGESTLVGIGATVLPRARIGDRAVIGGGAVVTGPVPDDTTVTGIPARAAVPGPVRRHRYPGVT